MPWTWERIEEEWLRGARVAHLSDSIIDCFNQVDRVLGPDWIAARHKGPQEVFGSIPVAGIVGVGQQLRVLRRIQQADRLVERLKGGDTASWAELAAVHALTFDHADVEVELEPEVAVKERIRKPDFRVRRGGGPWTYVEVSHPKASDERERAEAIINRVAEILLAVPGRYALEVYLRRQPTDTELDIILKRGAQISQQPGRVTEELPDQLGLLITNDTPVGVVVPKERDPGEQPPIIGLSRGIVNAGVPERQVVVRLAYTDQRADAFLSAEAQQLPKDSSGMIVLETTETMGSERPWLRIIERRFQPALHTRVGGIMLVTAGIETTPGGALWRQTSAGIVNPHAVMPLPDWLKEKVKGSGSQRTMAEGAADVPLPVSQ